MKKVKDEISETISKIMEEYEEISGSEIVKIGIHKDGTMRIYFKDGEIIDAKIF
jgi:polyribonucleotide nucleotidyltransferase